MPMRRGNTVVTTPRRMVSVTPKATLPGVPKPITPPNKGPLRLGEFDVPPNQKKLGTTVSNRTAMM